MTNSTHSSQELYSRTTRSLRLATFVLVRSCFLWGQTGPERAIFLDSLRFVTDSLRTSLEHALRDREASTRYAAALGDIQTISDFGSIFPYQPAKWAIMRFALVRALRAALRFRTRNARSTLPMLGECAAFLVKSGEVVESSQPGPAASIDRLYLVSASGLPQFRPIYDALSRMGFYSLNPDRKGDLQSPDAGELLAEMAATSPACWSAKKHNPDRKQRIEDYLSKVVPGVHGVDVKVIGPKETLEFRQQVAGSKDPWRFQAANMSDGTLRALVILVSLYQSSKGGAARVPLVGIEEPEIALLPAAAGLLLDSLREASRSTQVMVTSHSPDLLDDEKLDTGSILALYAEGGGSTHVAPLD